ncbi:hypothetical protein DRW41_13225 [Neobacillus piezotolerans]|uniref:WYL domain-containing protein n=1 Tax=Neobacillus piezotolerans TaxID=2259171 RepID=A0A3D8GR10_9BACI|nr:hypothetical protein [Neobacillus piezotolerans]RDU36486.1 hypothetical protein DRW41_13225 [Neobacillus piezotolerans]
MIKNYGYFEFRYGSDHYKNLQFIRKDHICDTSYMTFKNTLNGEVFTFEADKITELRFKQILDFALARFTEPLADTAPHSLY